MKNTLRVSIGTLILALAGTATADGVKFTDPTGDDKGPGNYTYPTDAVYTQGAFDLVEFEVTGGDRPELQRRRSTTASPIPGAWASASRRR